ncbi:MAG: fimbrillin family protein [Muribaculaceae bacterium]|nr:fimbrillin family protein [Muribaculaceae bacterium]
MSYKLIYSILALGSLTLATACSSTEAIDDSPADGIAVRFTARANDSRASITTNSTITNIPFVVYGDMVPTASASTATPTVIFPGTLVTYADNAWQYADPQYWFPNHTHSFVAIHTPAFENITNLTYSSGKLTFEYAAPTDYTKVPDILTAAHRRQYAPPATSVTFNFGHTMARINFIAKIDASIPNQTISIDRIVIKGIASRASYSLQPAALGTAKQTSDIVTPTWTISGTPTRIAYDKNIVETITTGQSAELFPVEDALLVIPQTVTSDIEVELTYSRGGNSTTVSGRLRIPSASHGYAWAAGHSYSYSFTLGADDFLIFDIPIVKSWDEDEGGNYIVVDNQTN